LKAQAGRWRFLTGRGRGLVLPLLLLLAAALVLQNIESTPLASLRQALFDRYQRQMPRERNDEPVVIVSIDSQSLAEYGQWPWSRSLVARLNDKIQAGQPLAVGLDIIFAEADRYSPAVLDKTFSELPHDLLNRLPDPDARFAKSLAAGPSVLAVVGVDNALPGSRAPARPLLSLGNGVEAAATLKHFASAIVSRPQLELGASGEGLINASPDSHQSNTERGVQRRVPSLAFVNQQPFLSLPLEMIRQALGEGGAVRPEFDAHGMRALSLGDYRLPTQENGELLLHFGHANSHYYLSAADVLAGKHPPETFSSRFVIIGFNSAGLQDSIITPLGETVPGVDVHAQVIESMLAGVALQRPWWMPRLELFLLLAGGLLLILATPLLRARFALLGYVGLGGVLVAGGYVAFAQGRWLFDGGSLTLLLGPPFIAMLGSTLARSDAGRRAAEKALQLSREAAARDAGELDAARRIQMGLLPDPQKLFADEPRFAVAALLEAARAVGGDYYDCFMLDEHRLCLTIGDVSGKGVPASLFMAISKTLTGTLARRDNDLGLAMRDINVELSRENPEYLFVTALLCVINIVSGELEFVCAGHDAPLLLRNGEISRIATHETSGPPLCVIEDYPYISDRVQLCPGDRLCLFTDGVSEATEGSMLFGGERLAATLLAHQDKNVADLLTAVRDEIRRFEAGHPPSDDLTLLMLDYRGVAINAG